MSFMKKYACLYGEMEFTPEEQAEIGRFQTKLMKLAMTQNDEEVVDLFRQEFNDVDEETFTRINNYLEYFNLYEKNAQVGRAIGNILAPLSIALAAAPLIQSGIRHFGMKRELSESLKKIMRDHPELKNDPNVAQYFQAIADFAPMIAKNPLVAGNILMQMHRVGPAMVTPSLIKELIEMQSKTTKKPGEDPFHVLAKPVGQAASYFGKGT